MVSKNRAKAGFAEQAWRMALFALFQLFTKQAYISTTELDENWKIGTKKNKS